MIKVTLSSNVGRSTVIVSEDATIRDILEDNGFDYTCGLLTIDGASLGIGEIDSTLGELGITEKCYIMKTVKADNAAVMKVMGETAFIVSDSTLEEIKAAEKYGASKALTVYDEENEPVFVVSVARTGKGGANIYGVLFDATAGNDGKAIATIDLPEGFDHDYLVDNYGHVLANLKKVEQNMAATMEEVMAERAAAAEDIVIL